VLIRSATLILTACIAWGAFAFGAVRPWAYRPLMLVGCLLGIAALCAPSALQRRELASLGCSLGVLLLAIVVQLIPLPFPAIAAISPEAPGIIRQLEPAAALGTLAAHPLSIAPAATARGLAVAASLVLLLLGCARLFSISGVRPIVQAITIVGVVLALVGIIQRPLFTGKIYGLWTPISGRDPFGPFVNKNHFAGWMLMALPLTLALIGGAVARALRGRDLTMRARILWLSSPDASRILLWVGAATLMALSLILTMSRSGIGIGAIVAVAAAFGMLRGTDSQARRMGGLSILAVVVAGVVAWTGADVIAARFSAIDWGQLGNRKGAWLDAIDIARRYPLTGTGFNTYTVAALFYQRHDLFWHYAQAHNDYLQLAAEGGLLLVLPTAACVVAFIVAVRRRFREDTSISVSWLRAGAVTGLLAIALQDMVDFSLQMPGNAFLFAVISGIALHRAPGHKGMARPE
jgi:hypothetical protein